MDATRPAGNPAQIDHPRIPARVPPRRRPSGEPPPLPHHLGRTGKFWLYHGRVLRRHGHRRADVPDVPAVLRTLGHGTVAVAGVDPDPVAHQDGARCERAHRQLGDPPAPMGDVRGVDRVPPLAAPLRVHRRDHRAGAAHLSVGSGDRPGPPAGGDDPGVVDGILHAVATRREPRDHAHRDGLHPRRSREAPVPGEVGHRDHPRGRLLLSDCTWPSTSPTAATFGADPGRGGPAHRVPLLHAERGVPRRPTGEGKTAHLDVGGRARRGDPPRRRRTSSASRDRRSSPSGWRVRRLDAAAPAVSPGRARHATCSGSSTR